MKPSDFEVLYVVQCGDFYKLGITGDLEKRMGQLQTGNPYSIELIAFMSVNPSMRDIEGKLHKFYDDHRVIGEWFSISQEEIFNELACIFGERIFTHRNQYFDRIMKKQPRVTIEAIGKSAAKYAKDQINAVEKKMEKFATMTDIVFCEEVRDRTFEDIREEVRAKQTQVYLIFGSGLFLLFIMLFLHIVGII